ncbi:Os12g0608025, partial [Oryza sativa Japonica Group]
MSTDCRKRSARGRSLEKAEEGEARGGKGAVVAIGRGGRVATCGGFALSHRRGHRRGHETTPADLRFLTALPLLRLLGAARSSHPPETRQPQCQWPLPTPRCPPRLRSIRASGCRPWGPWS